jgi:phosphatidylglycerophosphate synthase
VPSPERPLCVDAREVAGGIAPWTRVAGVPLVARHVRQAARAGRRAVTVIVADEAAHFHTVRALVSRPARGVQIAVEIGEPPPGAIVVPALVVHAGGVPVLEIHGASDLAAAERRLAESVRKSVEHDGYVAYYLMRPIARLVVRALLDTRITPNQVTIAAMLLGVGAAIAAYLSHFALAGVLYWLGATVDCVDGDLARLRIEGSRAGEWLDTLADDVTTFSLLAGMAGALGGAWPTVAAVGIVSGLATTIKLYSDLVKLGLPIDTARYPFFFYTASPRESGRRLARAVNIASYLFKRDAYTTIIAACLLAGLVRAAFLLLFGGIEVITVLLLVHLVVTHVDESPRPRN